MKKLLVLALAVLLTVGFVAIADAARPDGTGITGSPHDFTDNKVGGSGTLVTDTTTATYEADGSGLGWNKRAEICRVCHVPHDHGRSQKYWEAYDGLLWNHAVVSADYTMYSSDSLDGAIDGDPSGVAKLCLGCHDGAVAVDTYDRYAGGNVYITDIESGFKVPNTGTAYDLTATHPISIVYDIAADTPTGGTSGLNATSTAMGTSGTIADVLDGGKVQCSSCHDVHNKQIVAGTHLLRVETSLKHKSGLGTASGLCLVCHNK